LKHNQINKFLNILFIIQKCRLFLKKTPNSIIALSIFLILTSQIKKWKNDTISVFVYNDTITYNSIRSTVSIVSKLDLNTTLGILTLIRSKKKNKLNEKFSFYFQCFSINFFYSSLRIIFKGFSEIYSGDLILIGNYSVAQLIRN
jgi:hypothetical protein